MDIGGTMKKTSSSRYFVSCFCAFAALSALTAVSGLVLSSSPSHAETSSVLASVTVPDVCTITADNSSTAHTDTVGVGEYKANIGETVFNITCNDNNGYSIYAVGYSNNTVGNTNLIGTTNGATIPTGTSTVTGSSAVSNWAMKLTAVSGTFPATILDSYDSYHVVPSTATKVATRTSSIDLSADSQIKTTYAVSISPAQTADSYVGKVKYTVVHPNNATAEGCIETPFSGYMQDITTTKVKQACEGITGILTDRRDNKIYTVAKLKDGNLWMTENLAIDLTTTTYDDLYGTGANTGKQTNATSEALSYLKGITTGTASDQWAKAAVKKNWTSSYSYSQPWIAVDSSTSGVCSDASTWCVNSTGAWSYDTVTPAKINNNTSIAQGKIGVYYNYCAASAGSYCWGGSGDSSTGSPSSDPNTSSIRDITSDICPYGWRLPTSSDSGEFKALYDAYSSNDTNFIVALSMPLSGSFTSGKANNQGNYGYSWSSTWYDSTHMYFLSVFGLVSPSSFSYRRTGNSVRCVFSS